MALGLLVGLGAAGARAEAARAAAFAISVEGVRTTVVATFEGVAAPLAPEAFLLSDPPRLVVDLPLVDWGGATPPPGRGLALGVRFGLAAPGRSRIVVDLAAPAALRGVALDPVGGNGVALTLRLEPAGPGAAAAIGGWPQDAPRPRRTQRPTVVVIDPGHGGVDPGASHGGLVEKAVALAFAEALAEALEARGAAVALTRSADVFVTLGARVAFARAAGADVLLSLHADAEPTRAASGASVYTLSAAASDARAAAVAARENAADATAASALAGLSADVAAALVDVVRRDVARASDRLGAALVAALDRRGDALRGRPLRAAAFRVLQASDIPAALIELGFLSNPQDRDRLADVGWRAATAAALADAVMEWASPP